MCIRDRIHTDPVENQQTEQQTWQAAQQQTAQQTWQAAPQQPSSPAPEAKKKGGKAAKVVALLRAGALFGGGEVYKRQAVIRADLPARERLHNGLADIVPADLVAQDLEIVQNLRLAGVGRLGF